MASTAVLESEVPAISCPIQLELSNVPSIWTGLFPLTLKLSLSHSDLDDWSFVWVQCPWMKSIYQMEFAIGCTEEKNIGQWRKQQRVSSCWRYLMIPLIISYGRWINGSKIETLVKLTPFSCWWYSSVFVCLIPCRFLLAMWKIFAAKTSNVSVYGIDDFVVVWIYGESMVNNG